MAKKRKDTSLANLTKSEMEVMNILWEADRPLTSAEIRESKSKWARSSTVFMLINGLLEKNAIEVVGQVRAAKVMTRLFSPVISKEDYQYHFFETFCDGSMDILLTGLAKTSGQEDQLVDQLKDWIHKHEDDASNNQPRFKNE